MPEEATPTREVTISQWDTHWHEARKHYCARLSARVSDGLPAGPQRDSQVPIILGSLLAYLDADAAIRDKIRETGSISLEGLAEVLTKAGIIGRGADPEWCQALLGTQQAPSRARLIRSLDL